MKQILCCALAALVTTGCASSSASISPQYVSPLQYQNYSCQQIGAEAERVSQRASQVAGVQDEKSTNDAIATTVGVVVFWPSLFLIKGDGQSAAELGRLRGEFEALEQAAIQKNCGLQFKKHSPPPAAAN
jgi:hypothetical protein